MKAQDYDLTANEKFVVWHTTLLMMTNEQLDHQSKARILNAAKMMCISECLDMEKIQEHDLEELEKSEKKHKEIEMIKRAIWKEMDKIMEVLTACYGEPKRDKSNHRCPNHD